MTVREILSVVNGLLNLGIDQQLFLAQADSSLRSIVANDGTIPKLLQCLNCVIDELACDYAPNTVLTHVVSKDGKVNYSDIDKPLLEVVSLTDSFGSNVRFRYTVDGLMTECSGRLELVYSTPYDKVDFWSEVNLSNHKLTQRTLAYAVCAEYCLTMGDYQGVALWDERYRNNLALASVKRSEMRMRERRWP